MTFKFWVLRRNEPHLSEELGDEPLLGKPVCEELIQAEEIAAPASGEF